MADQMSGVSSATLGSPLAPPLYFMCLGLKDVEVAFVDESCSHCGKMAILELWTRPDTSKEVEFQ